MRTLGIVAALLLIFFGLVVAGLVVVRIWQDNGLVRLDINTANVATPAATVPVSAWASAAMLLARSASGVANGMGEAKGNELWRALPPFRVKLTPVWLPWT